MRSSLAFSSDQRGRALRLGAVVLIGIAVLIAAAHVLPHSRRAPCFGGTTPGMRVEMLLGRNTGELLGVSATAFQAFLEREVTPRFPDGFTVQDASGQWRDTSAGAIMREPSYALVIVLRDAIAAAPKLQAVVAAYKNQFQQQSVLVSLSPTCFAL